MSLVGLVRPIPADPTTSVGQLIAQIRKLGAQRLDFYYFAEEGKVHPIRPRLFRDGTNEIEGLPTDNLAKSACEIVRDSIVELDDGQGGVGRIIVATVGTRPIVVYHAPLGLAPRRSSQIEVDPDGTIKCRNLAMAAWYAVCGGQFDPVAGGSAWYTLDEENNAYQNERKIDRPRNEGN